MPDAFRSNLLEADFEGVSFPVRHCTVDGGHDFVEHEAYLRRGADMEHTGQKAYRGTLEALFLNGLAGYPALFPGRWREFVRAVEQNPIGQLVHPTHGLITAAITGWTLAADPDQRSGHVVMITWVEHDASVADLSLFTGGEPTTIDGADSADALAGDVDAMVDAALGRS